ncbi:MAG TPA: NAD-dependent epimerase/dehydratase family protein [Steroidobacteraceae bacterium]|nr:NAD-dependent epimerase/dehydratase family protein [Steroidobacteraceae bacterium]
MQIFITSATGYVGAAVAACLRAHGHSITALARTPASEQRLHSAGIQVVRGDLAQADTYRAAAKNADVLIHTAFEYSADGAENLELDRQATRALPRGRRLIYTSNGYRPRVDTERSVLAASTTNSVLRLGMVYGRTGGGTIASLFGSAHRSRQLPYLADAAENRWSLIHLDDLAELYAHIVATPAGGVFDAVDGQPLTVRHTFERVGAVCGVRASMQSENVVQSVLEPHTVDVMRRDVALHSTRAQEIGWSPRYRTFDEGAAPGYAEWCAQ